MLSLIVLFTSAIFLERTHTRCVMSVLGQMVLSMGSRNHPWIQNFFTFNLHGWIFYSRDSLVIPGTGKEYHCFWLINVDHIFTGEILEVIMYFTKCILAMA